MRNLLSMLFLSLMLAGCATETQTRAAVTGGALGAAAGAAMAGDADQALTGAIVGGAVGAATGALLADPNGPAYRGDDRGGDDGYRYAGGWHGHDRRWYGRHHHRRGDDEGD